MKMSQNIVLSGEQRKFMISFLRGTILNKGEGFVILETNNVGYKVFVGATLRDELKLEKEAELYIYQNVKEDALDLYGFRSLDELGMFELLLSISGIGPKGALGVLTLGSLGDIKDSISRGDPSLLTKVSGIGRKTAERVVLELREKIGHLNFAVGPNSENQGNASGEEIDALIALGYSMQQARDSLRQVDSEIKDSGERIREALKKLGR